MHCSKAMSEFIKGKRRRQQGKTDWAGKPVRWLNNIGLQHLISLASLQNLKLKWIPLDLLKYLSNKNQNDKFVNDFILFFPGMLINVGYKTPNAKYFFHIWTVPVPVLNYHMRVIITCVLYIYHLRGRP